MKIAVRVNNWIGDVVMNVPALEILRQQYPHAELVAIARPWVAEILQFRPDLVNRCLPFDDKGEMRGARGLWRFSRQLRQEKFDLAVVFTKHLKGALMMALAGIPKRIGLVTGETRFFLHGGANYASLPRRGRHQSENYLDVVRHGLKLNLETKPVPQLKVPATRIAAAKAKFLPGAERPVLLVHAGAAYGTAKRWSASRYAAVIKKFLETSGGTAVLLGVASEHEVNRQIEEEVAHAQLINLCAKTKLAESLDLIASADLFISNDSGLMHVAGAFNVAQVAIFGPTDVEATFPNNQRAEVIDHPVTCSPCFKRHCPIGHDCMVGIEVQTVWEALNKCLPQPQ